MTVPKQVKLSGASSIGPIIPGASPFPSGECVTSINAAQTIQADRQFARSINSPAAFVDLLTGSGITNIRYLVLRARAGTFTVRVTSPGGVDQVWTLSDLLILSNPVLGSEWTALAVQGVGDIEVQIGGD